MPYLILSVVLFSFIHPLSKLILDTQIPLSYFCVLFVGIRFGLQLPALFFKPSIFKGLKSHLFNLLSLGLCGAGVQFLEFKGIHEGLNPALVTVVMFSYPVWILLGDALLTKKLNSVFILKVCLGLAGLVLVSGVEPSSVSQSLGLLIYPLVASFFIALWIVLSNKLKKAGLDSVALSFSYDFITLVFLLSFLFPGLEQTYPQFLDWSFSFNHWEALVFYSLFIGLLPNLLFYKGSQSLSPVVVALIMSSEPLFSTVYTSFIWGEAFSLNFFIGATLIVLVNLPTGFFKKLKTFSIKEVLQVIP